MTAPKRVAEKQLALGRWNARTRPRNVIFAKRTHFA